MMNKLNMGWIKKCKNFGNNQLPKNSIIYREIYKNYKEFNEEN